MSPEERARSKTYRRGHKERTGGFFFVDDVASAVRGHTSFSFLLGVSEDDQHLFIYLFQLRLAPRKRTTIILLKYNTFFVARTLNRVASLCGEGACRRSLKA